MSRKRSPIPIEDFRDVVEYNPETGAFLWKPRAETHYTIRTWNARFAGAVATRPHKKGYERIQLRGKDFLAHRVAYALYFREQPLEDIDHINGQRNDNRISNLRLATQSQNNANQRSRTDFPKGVSLRTNCPRNPYYAQLKVEGKHVLAKCFSSLEEAVNAYNTALIGHFGDHGQLSTLSR